MVKKYQSKIEMLMDS